MQLKVLGAGAGGGFPQWNCQCVNCAGVRNGSILAHSRTQSSIALSQDGSDWLLVNASPDILQQIRQTKVLEQARHVRDSGIAAVLLMDAQIDHVTGLLMLRENVRPLPLYATAQVLEELRQGFPILSILQHYCTVAPHPIALEAGPFALPFMPDLEVWPLALSSKPPPYSPHRDHPRAGDNIGLRLRNRHTGVSIFYAPGLGAIEPAVAQAMQSADILLVDGTFWTDDEMIDLGLSQKTAQQMGHLALSGADGMVAQLQQLAPKARKILIHINNTNPVLREDSAERAALREAGIELAFDGMEIVF